MENLLAGMITTAIGVVAAIVSLVASVKNSEGLIVIKLPQSLGTPSTTQTTSSTSTKPTFTTAIIESTTTFTSIITTTAGTTTASMSKILSPVLQLKPQIHLPPLQLEVMNTTVSGSSTEMMTSTESFITAAGASIEAITTWSPRPATIQPTTVTADITSTGPLPTTIGTSTQATATVVTTGH